MTAAEFENLTFNQQMNWLYYHGDFVTSIQYYSYKVNLFKLDKMLVEVFYSRKHDRIDKIELFDFNSKRLTFYIDQIRLSDLGY